MYHVELRQFPHNFCRFNLGERELREAILAPWVRGVPVEVGERRWNPLEAKLTVLEGPQLAVQELSMGRGWRNATRRCEDVTERVIAAARGALQGAAPGHATLQRPALEHAGQEGAGREHAGDRPAQPSCDALAAELLALLGEDPGPLLRAWQLALERHPDRTPSECLALAEDLVRR